MNIKMKTKTIEVYFDGGFNTKEADQDVERCRKGAVNLHIYQIGSYEKCDSCKHQKRCKESALTAGEQAF